MGGRPGYLLAKKGSEDSVGPLRAPPENCRLGWAVSDSILGGLFCV